jgi:Leucine-rich repeat (LRR) protein
MDLAPLDGLVELKRIYCDKSLVKYEMAQSFMQKNPSTLVIFESDQLTRWWASIPDEWRKILTYYTRLDEKPSKEQLHRLSATDSINISGRSSITSLAPLEIFRKLRRLECASSGISDLSPLKNLTDITEINISSTKVSSIDPLAGLTKMTLLNMDNTKVSDLDPLSKLPDLTMIYADNTGVTLDEATRFSEQNPDCLVIFQTYENTNWWKNLSEAWKKVLLDQIGISGVPDKISLQKIANLEKLEVSENFQITNLQPLLHLSRLREISLTDTPITSLDVLGQMKQLRIIRVTKNPVSDLTPIAGLTGLQELDISNTQVEKLDPIQNLTNLETLKFSGTPVKNLKYLARMIHLKVVEMYNTRVSSLDVLEPMTNLKSLKIFNTKISEKKVGKFKESHPECEVIFY